MHHIDQQILDQIQPVVLVGGQSSRFGRDKLVEPVDGSPMVTIPINALRSVFGPRVAVVGQCAPSISCLADMVIKDPYPDLGPVGGICAALQHVKSDIFVCAGDMVTIDQTTIYKILNASVESQRALAILAQTEHLHPTIGIYRAGCEKYFSSAIHDLKLKLGLVLELDSICRVPVNPGAMHNINRPEDL